MSTLLSPKNRTFLANLKNLTSHLTRHSCMLPSQAWAEALAGIYSLSYGAPLKTYGDDGLCLYFIYDFKILDFKQEFNQQKNIYLFTHTILHRPIILNYCTTLFFESCLFVAQQLKKNSDVIETKYK